MFPPSHRSISAALLALIAASGCKSAPSEPVPEEQNKSAPGSTMGGGPAPAPQAAAPRVPARPVASVRPSPDDPLAGKFTLEDATAGLEGSGPLAATIETDQGNLECKLFEDKAPITVANFVGLARGV